MEWVEWMVGLGGWTGWNGWIGLDGLDWIDGMDGAGGWNGWNGWMIGWIGLGGFFSGGSFEWADFTNFPVSAFGGGKDGNYPWDQHEPGSEDATAAIAINSNNLWGSQNYQTKNRFSKNYDFLEVVQGHFSCSARYWQEKLHRNF